MGSERLELEGRIAIVTGGGRGIGRGIALELARSGADLLLADIDLANAERTAKEIEQLGRRVHVQRVDVTDGASAKAGVEAAVAALGGLDILVNNAGVVQDRTGEAQDEEDFDRCYAVNLKGIWNMTTAAVPHFRRGGSGKVVNIASIAGRRGGFGLGAYCASKAAAISLTQSLATGLGAENINVNAVCPGLLWTEMWRKLEGMFRQTRDDETMDERAAFDAFLAERCPLRREQTPEDIGHAVAFLVSDRARNITGQALNVDGGIEMN
jgi:meso-butanediol dehydrogenase/(S,S)-butanediol dehydrogenase/diacetyl reductase